MNRRSFLSKCKCAAALCALPVAAELARLAGSTRIRLLPDEPYQVEPLNVIFAADASRFSGEVARAIGKSSPWIGLLKTEWGPIPVTISTVIRER